MELQLFGLQFLYLSSDIPFIHLYYYYEMILIFGSNVAWKQLLSFIKLEAFSTNLFLFGLFELGIVALHLNCIEAKSSVQLDRFSLWNWSIFDIAIGNNTNQQRPLFYLYFVCSQDPKVWEKFSSDFDGKTENVFCYLFDRYRKHRARS